MMPTAAHSASPPATRFCASFSHCHDYFSTQGLRDEKAFWQLLYLIFAKILDEQQSKRLFFVGATERNTPEGQTRIAKRIHALFDLVKDEFKDVFDGYERLEMNERALAYVAAQLARFDLLSTDTDAKGMAFEAITSHTLKQKKGQFFTPRNVIRMMVDMVDPQPGKRVLDPACGSGGFLIVALNHARRRILGEVGCPHPDDPFRVRSSGRLRGSVLRAGLACSASTWTATSARPPA
jgi:type I restriction enzyme M protein